jgi:hypothetical protein
MHNTWDVAVMHYSIDFSFFEVKAGALYHIRRKKQTYRYMVVITKGNKELKCNTLIFRVVFTKNLLATINLLLRTIRFFLISFRHLIIFKIK